jgi:hypothetical protein
MMPPTRWRDGNGFPRRSNSTGATFADFTSGFAATFGAAGLLIPGFFGFMGISQ